MDVAILTQDEKNEQLLNAAPRGNLRMIASLLSAGADIEAAGQFGDTALIAAARNGHTAVVEYLLLNNANKDSANQFGNTALILATYNGHTTVMAQLIAAGANKDAADQWGHTALIVAARLNRQEAGFLLLNTVSSERIEILSHEPDFAPLIQSFHRVIFMVKNDTVNIFMGLFSGKQPKIPVDLMNPILAFIFPSWLRSRKDLQIEEIPTLKRLWGETPGSVISAAAEDPLAQAPVPVTFRHSAAADERKEEGPLSKKHKPNGNR